MNPLLIEELFIQICYHISKVRILIEFETISKWHKEAIRKNKWLNLPVQIKNDDNVFLMLKTHNFGYLDLSFTEVTDKCVSKLVNIHTLNLRNTKVTDKAVSKLVNVHTLDLTDTDITEKVLVKLINARVIYVIDMDISDECIQKMRSNGCIVYV